MMEHAEILNLTKDALENDRFYELLTGKSGYGIPIADAQMDIPTDWEMLIQHGIYGVFKENKNVYIAFVHAIYRMLGQGSTELWMAANVLFYQLQNQDRGVSPFVLPKELLIEFRKELRKKKTALACDRDYAGRQYENGLLGDLERFEYVWQTGTQSLFLIFKEQWISGVSRRKMSTT